MHAHACECRRVQASAAWPGSKFLPHSLFFLGGSAQLSFRARVRRIGASDGELGRGSRHRPSLSCQSANPGKQHGSQMHRCKRASEPPHKSNLAGACKREREREREKPTAHISPRLACCSRARAPNIHRAPARQCQPQVGRPLSLSCSIKSSLPLIPHVAGRPSPSSRSDQRGCNPTRVDGKRNSLLLMLRRGSGQPAYLACEAGPHQ